jgi:hypothetical protein
MLVVHIKDSFELVYLDENETTLSEKKKDELLSLYGQNSVFDYFNQDLTLSKFHDENTAMFELGIDESGNRKIFVYKRISISADKLQITADGIDTATITATVDDPNSTETIELYHSDTLVDSKPAVNGVATFEVTMTEPGTLTLTVKSTTKYGKADVTIGGI